LIDSIKFYRTALNNPNILSCMRLLFAVSFNFTQTCLGVSELGGMQIALILYRDKYDVKKSSISAKHLLRQMIPTLRCTD